MIESGWYQQIFNLIATHVYGGVELTADMNLVATLFATIFSMAAFCLPVIVVLWMIKFVMSWRF